MITTEERDYFSKILQHLKAKDYETALLISREAVTKYPRNPLLLAKEITALFRTGHIKEARVKADSNYEFLKKDTYFLNTYLGILSSLKQKRDIEQVLDTEIIGSSDMHHESVYLYAEQLARRLFSPQKANAVIEKAKSLFPHSSKIVSLGKTENKDFKYYVSKFESVPREEAIEEIESIRGLPEFSKDVGLHTYLGKLYETGLNYEAAIGIYKYILSFTEDYQTRTQLGFTYYHMGDMDSALVYLEPAFVRSPHNVTIRATVIKIFQLKKDYAGFERLISKALAVHPEATYLFGVLKKAEKWKQD